MIKQTKLVLLSCFILGLILVSRRASMEGFKDTEPEKPEKFNPEIASYQLLKSVMGPIRRISKIVLNPTNWKERISMATMSPTELARMYMKSQQALSTT